MKEGRDLAVTLIMSAILLVSVSYLTQCSATQKRPSPASDVATQHNGASTDAEGERAKAAGKPKSVHELAEEEDEEERAKIQRVGHALQTIGANPELRKTLGIPE